MFLCFLLFVVIDKQTVTDQRLAINAVVASKDVLDLFLLVRLKKDPLEGSEVEFSYLVAGTVVACDSCKDVLKRIG